MIAAAASGRSQKWQIAAWPKVRLTFIVRPRLRISESQGGFYVAEGAQKFRLTRIRDSDKNVQSGVFVDSPGGKPRRAFCMVPFCMVPFDCASIFRWPWRSRCSGPRSPVPSLSVPVLAPVIFDRFRDFARLFARFCISRPPFTGIYRHICVGCTCGVHPFAETRRLGTCCVCCC
jgi:hypothetical protein